MPKENTTYKRKYYLHRKIYAIGAVLQLTQCERTILIYPDQYDVARQNKYVQELQSKYSYGVQLLNPMTL
jgi:hypothetical protein